MKAIKQLVHSAVKAVMVSALPLWGVAGGVLFASCEDFFDQESDHVLYDNVNHLDNAVDSVYSVTGIMSKLQAIADRTIILGEVRADLVDLTLEASSDLRDVANFCATSDNVYNQPRDYYAVINNCNYFIAHADTTLKSNRNESIFLKEYAAVKAFRAWTYLQLVLNYGRVPFVTEPILTKEQAEQQYPMYTLQDVCQYFLNDLSTIPERYNTEVPGYGDIRNTQSRFFYFPLSILRGDMNLWLGSLTGDKEFYRQAALNYYKYLDERNGMNSAYPTGISFISWEPGSTTNWTSYYINSRSFFSQETWGSGNSELITMIPGDSIRAEGNYSELRNLFNSTTENDYKPSITPSQGMQDISAAQTFCCLGTSATSVVYTPKGLGEHQDGDLRLYDVWSQSFRRDAITGDRIETQQIGKFATRNVHIYRRQMVYLRLAEALNLAGYPRMAFLILSSGLDGQVMKTEVEPYYTKADSVFLAQFPFPTTRYGVLTKEEFVTMRTLQTTNTMGMHTRGSGWTPMNEYYQLPNDTSDLMSEQDPKREQLIAEQQLYVDSLIINEEALEFAFEGLRYYDLMRYAMRSSNPGQTMKDFIYRRRGESRIGEMQSEIKADLGDQRNWYLQWNGQIGF